MVSIDTDKTSAWYSKPTAERAVITLCLKSMNTFIDVSSKLSSNDFLDSNNRALFTVISTISAMGVEEFDLPTVASSVNDMGILEEIGGWDYIDALFQSEINAQNLDVYVGQVLDASTLYRLETKLVQSAEFVHSQGNMSTSSASEVISTVEDSVLGIGLDTLKIEDGRRASEGLLERLKIFESNPSTVRGIKSGFPILDRILNGFKPGGLYVVGARPKVGKSTLLSNWAAYMSIKEKVPVLYIDTEMPFEEWQLRMLSSISTVPERVIENGLYSNNDKQMEAVYYAVKIMDSIILIHKYMPGFRIEDVRSVVRKYHARNNIGAFFFDYIKMVEMSANFNETQTLGYLTSSLKDLAGLLNIPVITAVQINRTGEGKSKINSDQIADSDRVLRYCNVLMALSRKQRSEIEAHGISSGTHRLQILDNRGGSGLYNGIDLMSKQTILTLQEASVQSSDSMLEQQQLERERSF